MLIVIIVIILIVIVVIVIVSNRTWGQRGPHACRKRMLSAGGQGGGASLAASALAHAIGDVKRLGHENKGRWPWRSQRDESTPRGKSARSQSSSVPPLPQMGPGTGSWPGSRAAARQLRQPAPTAARAEEPSRAQGQTAASQLLGRPAGPAS